MYSTFYNLTGVPFQLTPDPGFYFPSRTHDKALSYLTYGLSQRDGIIAVTGDEGTGTSTVLAHFLAGLDDEDYVYASLTADHIAADRVLGKIASKLGIDHAGLTRDALLKRLRGFLESAAKVGQRVLIILDEADDVTVDLLNEIRLVTDHLIDGDAPAQLILFGGAGLRQKLAESDAFEPIQQRIIASCALTALGDVKETGDYIQHRLRQVGWDGDPAFTDAATGAIHVFCNGVPRRINQLCSRLLLHGSLESLHEINEDTVAKVTAELVVDNSPDERQNGASALPVAGTSADTGSETADLQNRRKSDTDDVAPVAFDRRSVIETDASAESGAAPTVEVRVEDETPASESSVTPSKTPEPTPVVAPGTSGDQQLVAAIITELGRIDPALPRLLCADLFGEEGAPEGPDQLAEGGDSKRLGLGPLTASMLYRAVSRELASMDQALVRAALTGVPKPDEASDQSSSNAEAEALLERLDKVEKRVKKTEKLLTKAVKALKRRK